MQTVHFKAYGTEQIRNQSFAKYPCQTSKQNEEPIVKYVGEDGGCHECRGIVKAFSFFGGGCHEQVSDLFAISPVAQPKF